MAGCPRHALWLLGLFAINVEQIDRVDSSTNYISRYIGIFKPHTYLHISASGPEETSMMRRRRTGV